MKVTRDPFSVGLAAFRRLTAEEAPLATVTRARVLAGMQRRRWRGSLTLILSASALLVIASAALVAAPWIRERLAPPREGGSVSRAPVSPRPIPRSGLSLPAPPAELGPAASGGDEEELRLYGQAHAAHFNRRQPRAALQLWNEYLAKFPAGRFVPEASYNRALDLARLGRARQAIATLKPIAAGRFGAYRRQEAEALIDALSGFLTEEVR